MVLGKLEVFMEKDETQSFSFTLHTNQLKMDHRSVLDMKC